MNSLIKEVTITKMLRQTRGRYNRQKYDIINGTFQYIVTVARHWTGTAARHWTGTAAPHWTSTAAPHWTGTAAPHWTGTVVPRWTGTWLEVAAVCFTAIEQGTLLNSFAEN